MTWPSLEYLGCPECRERHRVRPGRPDSRAAPEPVQGLRTDLCAGRPRGGGAQAPKGAAPAVLRSGLALPAAVVTEAVKESSVRRLRLGQETKVAVSQSDQFLSRRWLPAHHDQAAGNIVNAVAMFMPGRDSFGVLKQADVVGHALQVLERHGDTHAGTPAPVRMSRDASSRYECATAGHSICGARSAEYLLIRADRPGSVSARCSAAAMPAGSCRSTRSPAPRSSTACGKHVDTTGLPAVTASIKTPEVTCSSESYGSSTTSAAPISLPRVAAGKNRPSKVTRSRRPRACTRATSAFR